MNAKPSLLTRRRVVLFAVAFLFSSYWRRVTMAAEGEREALPWERPGQLRRDAEPLHG